MLLVIGRLFPAIGRIALVIGRVLARGAGLAMEAGWRMVERVGELTVSQIEQVGRVLAPLFRDAIRPDFHKVREDVNGSLLEQFGEARRWQEAIEKRLAQLDERVSRLEQFRWKVAGIWTALAGCAGVTGSALIHLLGVLVKG